MNELSALLIPMFGHGLGIVRINRFLVLFALRQADASTAFDIHCRNNFHSANPSFGTSVYVISRWIIKGAEGRCQSIPKEKPDVNSRIFELKSYAIPP